MYSLYSFVCALLFLVLFSGLRILQLVALGTGSTRQVGTCRTIIVYGNTARASPIIRHDAFIRRFYIQGDPPSLPLL